MATDYLTSAEMKATLSLTGQSFADADIAAAITAASRMVDGACDRRFYLDADALQVNYYTPDSLRRVMIDDLVVLTSLKIDRGGTGSFTETWTLNTDFVLEPLNAPTDFVASPYESVHVRSLAGRWLPSWVERSVQVTGQFGWPAVPQPVKTATSLLANRMLKRVREAPLGIVAVGVEGTAMRLARTDPDVAALLAPYYRPTPFL